MALEDQLNPALNPATQNELFDTAFSWEPKKKHQFILQMADTGIPAFLVKMSDINNVRPPLAVPISSILSGFISSKISLM